MPRLSAFWLKSRKQSTLSEVKGRRSSPETSRSDVFHLARTIAESRTSKNGSSKRNVSCISDAGDLKRTTKRSRSTSIGLKKTSNRSLCSRISPVQDPTQVCSRTRMTRRHPIRFRLPCARHTFSTKTLQG